MRTGLGSDRGRANSRSLMTSSALSVLSIALEPIKSY